MAVKEWSKELELVRLHKKRQREFHDKEGLKEYNICRPHFGSRFFEYIWYRDLTIAAKLYPYEIKGKELLCVCCGNGFEAEFFSKLGANVTGIDISPGNITAAKERMKRFNFRARFLIGEAENPGFEDKSFDIVVAHDALHHLSDPAVGLKQMARIAKEGVIVIEPFKSFITPFLVRVGLQKKWEDSGNYVHRFSVSELRKIFSTSGFDKFRYKVQFLKKQHFINRFHRFLDFPPIFYLAKATVYITNVLFSKIGNVLIFESYL